MAYDMFGNCPVEDLPSTCTTSAWIPIESLGNSVGVAAGNPAVTRILLEPPAIFDTNASRCVKIHQIPLVGAAHLAIPPRRDYIFCRLKSCRQQEALGHAPGFFVCGGCGQDWSAAHASRVLLLGFSWRFISSRLADTIAPKDCRLDRLSRREEGAT